MPYNKLLAFSVATSVSATLLVVSATVFAQVDVAQAAAELISNFKITKFAIGTSSVVSGLLAYALYRRWVRKQNKFAGFLALASAAVLAPALVFGISTILLSEDGRACWSIALRSGADADAFDKTCQLAREDMGNVFLGTSLWGWIVGRVSAGASHVALSAGVTKAVVYLTATLVSLVFYMLCRLLYRVWFVIKYKKA